MTEFNKDLISTLHKDIKKYLSKQFKDGKPFHIMRNKSCLFSRTVFVVHDGDIYIVDVTNEFNKEPHLIAKPLTNTGSTSFSSCLAHLLYPKENTYIKYVDYSHCEKYMLKEETREWLKALSTIGGIYISSVELNSICEFREVVFFHVVTNIGEIIKVKCESHIANDILNNVNMVLKPFSLHINTLAEMKKPIEIKYKK